MLLLLFAAGRGFCRVSAGAASKKNRCSRRQQPFRRGGDGVKEQEKIVFFFLSELLAAGATRSFLLFSGVELPEADAE